MCRMLCVVVCALLWMGGALAAAEGGMDAALALLEEGQFKAAAEAFKALPDEPDSREYMLYASARDFERGGYFEQASALYPLLTGFLDADGRLAALVMDERMYAYQGAAKLEEQGDDRAAADAFRAIGEYMDSQQRADALDAPIDPAETYAMAERLEADGDLLGAHALYAKIPDHQDALVRGMSCHVRWQEQVYEQAVSAESAGDADEAARLFASLNGYRDSAERADTWSRAELYPFYDEDAGAVGYMDVRGDVVLAPQWDWGFPFADGLARVWSEAEDRYGFIDREGDLIYNFAFEYAEDFIDGTAYVYTQDSGGVITLDGQRICGIGRELHRAAMEECDHLFRSAGGGTGF